MNCLPSISVALSLMAFLSGVWFLQKAKKEEMSSMFRVAAWFVIIGALLNMGCCGMRCMRHGCDERGGCERPHGGPGGKHCGWKEDGGNSYNINSENCWINGNDVRGAEEGCGGEGSDAEGCMGGDSHCTMDNDSCTAKCEGK